MIPFADTRPALFRPTPRRHTAYMDWFEHITGFREDSYEATRALLRVEDGLLVSDAQGRRFGVGRLEIPSLGELRQRVAALPVSGLPIPAGHRVSCLTADVRDLLRDPSNAGAIFQVASQFNLLEMTSPQVSPEDGVTRYRGDPTQGPACAIAAGAATIYRNYLVPCAGGFGQTRARQIDTLAPLSQALSQALSRPVHALWAMRNGYAMCSPDGLHAIVKHLRGLDEPGRDALRSLLTVGLHHDVQITDPAVSDPLHVTQVFCSALPVAYTKLEPALWEPFARLVLEAAYEATLLAAALARNSDSAAPVYLTSLGGGAFGNDTRWIEGAMDLALHSTASLGLDVRLVSYGDTPRSLAALAARHDKR